MSNNKGNKFNNKAARRFKDIAKVDTMSQKLIYETFDDELKIILDQVTAFREHRPNAPYPQYVANAFANLSTALFFYEFIDDHVKIKKKKGKKKIKTDMDKDEAESMRQILADAYKKSVTSFYSGQLQEFEDRNKLLSKAFVRLSPELYDMAGKFGLTKSQRRDITIQIYGDPVYNFRFIHKLVNQSTLPDKKKLHLLIKMYGKKRFVKALGAAMTVEGNNSDCLAMLFEFMMNLSKKKRAPYLMAYADAFKKNKSKYFRIDEEFCQKNRKLIKELKRIDIGYKKAFKPVAKSVQKRNKGNDTRRS